ncbi:MAG: amidohydrolase [Lentisphaeria bacterium]|nr:amidohydrolase [Lentisphaeria bacterium]
MRYWITNAKVNTAVEPGPQDLDILIEDGKIVRLGKYDSGDKIDAGAMQVFPGLVEAHCHLGLHGWAMRYEGADYNEKNETITPELDAIDSINPMDESIRHALEGGVTSVGAGPGSANVIGGTFAAYKTFGDRIDDMIIKKRVAMKCAFGENPKFLHQTSGISTRMTNAAKLREMLFKTREYLRKKEAAEKDDASKSPDFNFKLEALIPVIRGEMPLKAHAHQANDIFTAIRIAREFGVKLTIEHCTEGHLIAQHLAKEGYPVACGPTFNNASKIELRNKTFATPGILNRAGCQVSIITDSPVTPQEYLGLVAGLAVRSGMDPFAALQTITINPARHLGIEGRVGSIEPGKDADLIFCNCSILDSMAVVKRVILNGETVVDKQ